jgi:2-iminobutanoate/2-iminopropanoate deaminase
MMGIGQVVTLKLPADQLRAINRAIELYAWGAFQTEFYPTYDFRPIRQEITAHATGSQAGS